MESILLFSSMILFLVPFSLTAQILLVSFRSFAFSSPFPFSPLTPFFTAYTTFLLYFLLLSVFLSTHSPQTFKILFFLPFSFPFSYSLPPFLSLGYLFSFLTNPFLGLLLSQPPLLSFPQINLTTLHFQSIFYFLFLPSSFFYFCFFFDNKGESSRT